MEAIEECQIGNIVFCYMYADLKITQMKCKDSDCCMRMVLYLIQKIVRDKVNKEGDDADMLRVKLLQAINKIIEEVKLEEYQ